MSAAGSQNCGGDQVPIHVGNGLVTQVKVAYNSKEEVTTLFRDA